MATLQSMDLTVYYRTVNSAATTTQYNNQAMAGFDGTNYNDNLYAYVAIKAPEDFNYSYKTFVSSDVIIYAQNCGGKVYIKYTGGWVSASSGAVTYSKYYTKDFDYSKLTYANSSNISKSLINSGVDRYLLSGYEFVITTADILKQCIKNNNKYILCVMSSWISDSTDTTSYEGATFQIKCTTPTYYDNEITLTPSYPINSISINGLKKQIFAWNFEQVFDGDCPTSQTVTIHNEDTETDYTFEISDATPYYEVPANTLPSGNYTWFIYAENDDGQSYTSSVNSFVVTGKTSGADITDITSTVSPTITWEVSNQDAYEIYLMTTSGDEICYTGLLIGSDVRTWTYSGVLTEGTYVLKIRILNTYGYYTDWTEQSFLVSYNKPTAPSNVTVSVDDNYGIDIDGIIESDLTGLVMRNDVKIAAFGNSIYTDYKTPLNTAITYTLASTDGTGMALGDEFTIQVKADGIVIHDVRDFTNFVHINQREGDVFDIARADEQSKTFRQVIGRTYPIKEMMDYIISTRSFEAAVTDEDFEKLMDMMLSVENVYYRADGESFLADLVVEDEGAYIGGGRLVSITITRLNEED